MTLTTPVERLHALREAKLTKAGSPRKRAEGGGRKEGPRRTKSTVYLLDATVEALQAANQTATQALDSLRWV